MDLYRYTSRGVVGTDSVPGYFSEDGGVTSLAVFNSIPRGDFGDWTYPGAGLDAFRGGITPDTVSPITSADQRLMRDLGFTLGTLPLVLSGPITKVATADGQILTASDAWGNEDNYDLYGNGFSATLQGGPHDDELFGGTGAIVTLNGGAGTNYEWGGNGTSRYLPSGRRIFVIQPHVNKTDDVIQDWTPNSQAGGLNQVRIVNFGWTQFSDVLAHASPEGGGYLDIHLNDHTDVELLGATLSNLIPKNFIFVNN